MKIWVLIFIIASSFMFLGCSTNASKNEVVFIELPKEMEARNAAIGFALTQDIVTASIAKTCGSLGFNAELQASASREIWKKNNWHFVDSAHKDLKVQAALIENTTGQSADAYYASAKSEIMKNVSVTLQDIFPTASDVTEKRCHIFIDAFKNGGFDFSKNSEFYPILVDIYQGK